jgi:glycosyltransferase involved in cell wall biosynthesis
LKVSAVHQVIPSFVPRDAIGDHSLQVRSVLQEMGLESEVYVADAGPGYERISKPYQRYRGGGGDVLLYQASTGSAMADWLLHRPEPKLLNYHNITPAATFNRWEPRLAEEMAEGRRQISKLSVVTSHAIAVSRYNEEELVAAGYRSTCTAPLLLDPDALAGPPDPVTTAWLERIKSDGGPDVVFVGRIVPNKAQHDLVKALVAYRRYFSPRARLHLVGGAASPWYLDAIRRFVAAVDLWEAVDLAGVVSNAERSAYLRGADVYVSLSEHEGFGVPLLEAMANDVPVIAYACAAVPETVGDAALLLPSKDPAVVAAAIDRVVSDPVLRAALVAAGRRRLEEYSLQRSRARFTAAIRAGLDRVE